MPSNFEITAELSFQPTLPLRGATVRRPIVEGHASFQPTLPLRGATLGHIGIGRIVFVSTHAPLAGSD